MFFPRYTFFKSIVDRVFALLLIFILSPLIFLLIVLSVRFIGFPVFFVQRRPGHLGKPFDLVKFRSMKNSFDASGELLPDNLRITAYGSFIRSTSLDELPSLFNVLRGDMSFVGPRPLLMRYLPLYSSEQFRRHDVMPGFSGLAQIRGRNTLSWEEKFRLDVWYVDHQNFWLDLRIFLVTIWKVISREGINAAGEVTMSPFLGTTSTSDLP